MSDEHEIGAESANDNDIGEAAVEGEVVVNPELPARLSDQLPTNIPVLVSPLGPVFPGMMTPIQLADGRIRETVDQATPYVGLVARRPGAEPGADGDYVSGLYTTGCVGQIVEPPRRGEGGARVLVAGLRRMRIVKFTSVTPVLRAEVEYPDETVDDQRETEALFRRLRANLKELAKVSPDIPDEVGELVDQVGEAPLLADFVASNLGEDIEVKQDILADFELGSRLRRAMLLIEKRLDIARLGAKLQEQIRSNIESRQKEHYLREQMRVIRRELGEEVDQRELDRQTYAEKIAAAEMPEEAEERAQSELDRLTLLAPEASEYHVIRNYLDWLVDLPWSKVSDDKIDIADAARILDEDHYGLEEVKERIVEFLAVRKLKPDQQGAILCLVGPPGVGKTSLGQSVARAMGREFYRVSLGGMRDEAEIKGHRRTYVGAMPGKIVQGLRRVATRNPVFMLDELDKLGSDWRGDPASALLEVLDPAQNHAFSDHYIDLPFDLSQVMFIATANVAAQIPRPLLDRTEVISLSGYIPEEKLEIARRYLLPRQLEAHGLERKHLKMGRKALATIIDRYTRESGVRGLERVIGRACRKVAARVATRAEGEAVDQVVVGKKNIVDFLGPRRYFTELVDRCSSPGVVVGLAWTQVGGEILFIEATSMPGTGRLKLTGKLGDVMTESVQIAHSLIRSRAERFGIPAASFKELDIHLHVPAGAVPKDGPSAGVAMTCALLSLLWKGKGKAAKAKVAMTGEITLRGLVLPVGGLKEKVVAAKRAGVETVVVPKRNRPDIEEIPAAIIEGLDIIYVGDIEEAVRAVIGPLPRVSKK